MANEPFPRIRIEEFPRGVFTAVLPSQEPEPPVDATAAWHEKQILDFIRSMYWQQEW